MKRKSSPELALILILIIIGVAFYCYDAFVYKENIKTIKGLDKQIEKQNEQLIAAQILDQELSGVARLIQENLAMSMSDDLVKSSAVKFLKDFTTTVNELDIELLSIQPKPGRAGQDDGYLKSTYSIELFCNYKKLGQLINRIEKTDRIIWVDAFEIKTNIDYLKGKDHSRGIDTRTIELELSTITLLKNEI